jgi:hypothetical protein
LVIRVRTVRCVGAIEAGSISDRNKVIRVSTGIKPLTCWQRVILG